LEKFVSYLREALSSTTDLVDGLKITGYGLQLP
jgi:hypothetical protein